MVVGVKRKNGSTGRVRGEATTVGVDREEESLRGWMILSMRETAGDSVKRHVAGWRGGGGGGRSTEVRGSEGGKGGDLIGVADLGVEGWTSMERKLRQ